MHLLLAGVVTRAEARADERLPTGGRLQPVTSAGSAHAASATSTALPQVVPSTWSSTAPAWRCSPSRSDTSGRRSTVDVSLATSATGLDRRGRTRDNTFPTCRPNPDTVRMTPNLTSGTVASSVRAPRVVVGARR